MNAMIQCKVNGTQVTTGKVRASYAHVFTPQARNNDDGTPQDPKYTVSLLIPKSDTDMVQKIAGALRTAGIAKWGDKWDTVKESSGFRKGMRDGDKDRPDDAAYKGHYFVNCTSKNKPTIVDRNMNPITSPEGFRSGDYCRVNINAFAYSNKGKGVAFGLNTIQKLESGPPLAGGPDAHEVFEPLGAEEGAAATPSGTDELSGLGL